jgi:hypothetical protein
MEVLAIVPLLLHKEIEMIEFFTSLFSAMRGIDRFLLLLLGGLFLLGMLHAFMSGLTGELEEWGFKETMEKGGVWYTYILLYVCAGVFYIILMSNETTGRIIDINSLSFFVSFIYTLFIMVVIIPAICLTLSIVELLLMASLSVVGDRLYEKIQRRVDSTSLEIARVNHRHES